MRIPQEIKDKYSNFSYSGIYKIIFNTSGKFYIGSSYNIYKRLSVHITKLLNQKHLNTHLLNLFNKYGINDISFDVLEQCDISDLLHREDYYISALNPELNICKTATAVMKGRKHSDKTLLKLKGRKTWNKGIKRTNAEKLLMSKNRKLAYVNSTPEFKKWFSDLHRDRSSEYWLGKHLSESSKQKISIAARKRSKPIICLNNNKIYSTQLEAAIDLKIKQGHISEVLNGKRDSASGFKFKEYIKQAS